MREWLDTYSGLGAVLAAQIQRAPDRIALQSTHTPGLRLSYRALDRHSAELASALAAQGVQPGEVVALHLGRSLEMIVAMVAVVRLGATYAPIDPAAPPQRSARLMASLQPRLGVSAQPPEFDGPAATLWLSPPRLELEDSAEPLAPLELSLLEPARPWHAGSWDDCLYIMFTSGSTGVPKGVMVPARGLPALIAGAHRAPPQAGPLVWSQASSPAFDISNLEIWGALLQGGQCLVLDTPKPSLHDLGRFFRHPGLSHGQLTGGLFNAMVEDDPAAFAGLRQMVVGGERASPPHMRAFLLAHPGVVLINGYGPTETTIYSQFHTVSLADTQLAAGVPVGPTLPGTIYRFPPGAPADEPAELWLGGDCLAQGYFQDPEKTAERFVWQDGQRWYRSGDLMRARADGTFDFHGRIDRQVKVQGMRIELDEVELALAACPGVGEVAVFLRGDSAQTAYLVACYSLADSPDGQAGLPPEPADLQARLSLSLPLAAVPRVLQVRAQMPHTVNGKLDRARLEQEYDAQLNTLPREADVAQDVVLALRQALGAQGDAAALACGSRVWSARQVLAASAHIASRLLSLGAQPGDEVLLLLPRSPQWLLAMLAVLRCGAVYVPLDLASPPQRRDALVATLRPRLSVLSPAVSDEWRAQAQAWGWPCLELGEEGLAEASTDAAPEPSCWPQPDPQALACVMFTSGSTGLPKGVGVTRAGLARLVVGGDACAMGPGQRWAFMASPAFDAAHLEWGAPWLNQGVCVLPERDFGSLDDVSAFLSEQRITDAWLTASLFNDLVEHDVAALGGLRQLLIGGERLSAPHVRRVQAAWPGLVLINGYGPTENTTFTSCHRIQPGDTEDPEGIPIGRPIRGTQVRLEPVDGQAADVGELWVGGLGLAQGYVRQPEATERAFVWHQGQRWYRSGDWVRQRADGVLIYRGRMDRQVKLQGHRVELDEVERCLSDCPGLREAAVTVVGQQAHERCLAVAYSALAASDSATPGPADILAWLQPQLPPAALPRLFLPLDNMPRNLSGKLDRAALAQQCEQLLRPPAAGAGLPPTQAEPGPAGEAMNAEQAAVASLWRRCLALPDDQALGPDSDFSALGGSSLAALRLASALRSRWPACRVSAVELLRRPLLREHAAGVQAAPPDAPVRAVDAGPKLLSEVQQAVFLAGQLDPQNNPMLLHVALRLDRALPVAQLRRAFEQLAARHPMLRLLTQQADGQVNSWLVPELEPGWWAEQGRLEQAPDDLQWPEALLTILGRPMNPDRPGVPMRVDHWELASGGALLVWTVLHHVLDEASIDLALRELDALLRGQTLAPVLGSPFAFATLERAWADPDGVRAHAQAFARDLAQARLPFDPSLGPSDERIHALPVSTQQALEAACRRWHCTPFTPLLSAWGLAIQAVFGPEFRRIWTPFSRRHEDTLLECIHFGLDLRPLEVGARPNESLAEQVVRVQDLVLASQRPGFQPMFEVVQQCFGLSPHAARLAASFGFTWRLNPARHLQLGSTPARLIRVPQPGVRFALALHAARVDGGWSFALEAVAEATQRGWDQRVFAAFVHALNELCALPAWEAQAPAPGRVVQARRSLGPGPAALDPAVRQVAASAWRRCAPQAPGEPAADASFLLQGGSSLSAMRLVAQLQRELGLRVDLGVFLARPSFGGLLHALADASATEPLPDHLPAHSPAPPPSAGLPGLRRLAGPDPQPPAATPDLTILEDHPNQPLLLLIPGWGGHAVGLLHLAREIRRAAAGLLGVAIVDLAALVEQAPEQDVAGAVRGRLLGMAGRVGEQRFAGMLGFSMGGLLALQLAQDWPRAQGLPIVLLDAFPLHRLAHPQSGFWRRQEARLARGLAKLGRWFRPGGPPIPELNWVPEGAEQADTEAGEPSLTSPQQWDRLTHQLSQQRGWGCAQPVVLVQALHSLPGTFMAWGRARNGFFARDLPQLLVWSLPVSHLELARAAAPVVADLVVAQWRLHGLPRVGDAAG